MTDKNSAGYLVRRNAKVRTDGSGRSVWVDPVDSAELELVSTMALKKILQSDDAKSRESIEKAAADSDDGVLARDPANGQFEIIGDDELEALLDNNRNQPSASKPSEVMLAPLDSDAELAADELSLVSTQALRKLLVKDDVEPEPELETVKDTGGGFDPYNSN